MLIDLALFSVSLIMLYFGAEWLVKGASSLARSLGLEPLLIGLTVVAFGTSMPELVTCVLSSLQGKSLIALGNVVGSNICNLSLGLGLTVLFFPIKKQQSICTTDILIVLTSSFFLVLISLNSTIGRFEGVTLLMCLIGYIFFNYKKAINSNTNNVNQICGPLGAGIHDEKIEYITNRSMQIFLIVIGILVVVLGADILIHFAVKLMKRMGVGEKFIGITLIAFGTSLPEIATSLVAAIKKELDISIGALLGSNILNILCVIGLTSLVTPITIPGGLIKNGFIIDYAIMIFTSLLPWLIIKKTPSITKFHGIMFISIYAGYILFLTVSSSGI